MNCCQCCGIEEQFNRAEAARKLREYRRAGPARTTQLLLDALMREPIAGQTLLDIGGGVGSIQHALLKAGAATATDVDASTAYRPSPVRKPLASSMPSASPISAAILSTSPIRSLRPISLHSTE